MHGVPRSEDRKIRVYLNLLQGYHPVYQELIDNPPENVSYTTPPSKDYFTRQKIPLQKKIIKRAIKLLYQPAPAIFYAQTPAQTDLIHSTNNLMLLNNKPWVVDCEQAGGFLRFKQERYDSGIYRNLVERLLSRKACKAILPWSEAAKKSIQNYTQNQNIMKKTITLYPSIPESSTKAKKPKKIIKFLFIGRMFYEKGGREVLEAFRLIRKKCDCQLTMICDVPIEFKKEFKDSVDFHMPLFTRDEMKKIISTHHALLFPTYMDTFGFVILEAFASGLPVISTDIFCIPEMIEHEKSGLLLHAPVSRWDEKTYLFNRKKFCNWSDFLAHIKTSSFPGFSNQLSKEMLHLASDSSLWKTLSETGLEIIRRGKFSLKKRNEMLETIYQTSINQ
jgi:glycosyltransferase involved in cell wall biosynthesis